MMKGKKYLFVCSVFGMVIGWALGFLRLPHVEKNYSFWLGFIAALAFISLIILLLDTTNRNLLFGLTDKKRSTEDSNNTNLNPNIRRVLLGVFVLGGLATGLALYRQQTFLRQQIQNQDKNLREMAVLVETMKKNDLKPLLSSVLHAAGEELKHNPGRTLSDTLIARIAALSLIAQPYPKVEGDSLSEKTYSPERGQLLQALVLMHVDTGTFGRIKRKVLFAGADLPGADLKGLDLSHINLQGANLQNANLGGANLEGANLFKANFWGANLNQARMEKADLKRADLSWAQLNQATLRRAKLDGATLTNAQFREADLNDASIKWAQSEGVLFVGANLESVEFQGTNLRKANLSRANLHGADLRKINLGEADLAGVLPNKALVEKNWLEIAKTWQASGLNELLEKYSVVNDTFDKWNVPMYRLKKKD